MYSTMPMAYIVLTYAAYYVQNHQAAEQIYILGYCSYVVAQYGRLRASGLALYVNMNTCYQ